jgi:hypothetical protein
MVVSLEEYEQLQQVGYLPFSSLDDTDKLMDDWMLEQMKKRLNTDLFKEAIATDTHSTIGPHWLFPCKELATGEWAKGKILLEIKKSENEVLYFDDNSWVHVANSVMNGPYMYSYLAYSETEANAKENATKEEMMVSWERVFDITQNDIRDEMYSGSIELRAVSPFVSLDSIVRVEFL